MKSKLEEPGVGYVPNGSRDRFGRPRSNVGGRPRKQMADTATAGTHRRPGTKRSKLEFPAPELLAMGELVKVEIDKFWQKHSEQREDKALQKQLDQRLLTLWPGWKIAKIKQTAEKGQIEMLRERCKELHLGKMSKARCLNPQGSTLAKFKLKSNGLGVRKLLGAATGKSRNRFLKFWQMVKVWHSFERMMGHGVDQQDCYLEFCDVVKREIELLQAVAQVRPLSSLQQRWKAEMQERLQKLAGSEKYKLSYCRRLTSWMGARWGTPSKFTELTREQEQIRWQMTVQGFDNAVWRTAFGSQVELQYYVADPARFRERAARTALIFSDEIPFWVKLGHQKVLFADWEVKTSANRSKTSSSLVQLSQSLGKLAEHEDKRADEKVTQKRGPAKSGDDKFRITFEARQGVLNWFDSSQDPTGIIFPSILIVHGIHCRLENIDDDRCWKEDEEFIICGEKVVRRKGGKVPGALMKGWWQCRKAHPELFEKILVWQQPAANMDEVLNVWQIQDMMGRVPQGVWQRDLLAAAMTPTSKIAMKIGQFVPAWIGGGLTPVCQLTDTDIAFVLKAFARKAKEELLSDKKLAAKQQKQLMSLSCTPFEIMTIASKAHQAVEVRNAETKLVLAGLRRNGQLGYRPNLATGKLEKVEMTEGSWCETLKEGSHRYPASWLEDRYDWLDISGRPVPVSWKRAHPANRDTKVKVPEGPCPEKFHLPVPAGAGDQAEFEDVVQPISADDFAELEYSMQDEQLRVTHKLKFAGQDLEIPVLEIDFDGQDILPAEIHKLMKETPKERRLKRELDPDLLRSAIAKKKNKLASRLMIRKALASFSPEMHEGLKMDLKKYSRAEVMRKLQPVGAGKHKKASIVKKEVTKKVDKVSYLSYGVVG